MILYEQLGSRNALLRANGTTDVCLIDIALWRFLCDDARPLSLGGGEAASGGGAEDPVRAP